MTRRLRDRDARVTINREFASVGEYVANISRTGVFIRSDNPLPIGTRVNLCFSVIDEDVETIEGIGTVVRISERPPGMGVVFTRLDSPSQSVIDRIVGDDEVLG